MSPSMLDFALYGLPPLLVAVILHEIAHGWVAYKLGDPTAKNLGRLSPNPLVHIDPLMTIIVPMVLIISKSPIIFGGAKPVPVNPMYFANPRRGMMLVAVAGPLTNFALAAVCAVLFHVLAWVQLPMLMVSAAATKLIGMWLTYGMVINLVLGLFNLIPIPPLDGGRIAVGLLPLRFARALAQLERYGLLIVVVLLYAGVFDFFIRPVLKFVFSFMPLTD